MLNKSKLFQEIEKFSGSIFYDYSKELAIAQQAWDAIVQDKDFAKKVKDTTYPWIIPSWVGQLDAEFEVQNNAKDYSVISVDGSQIYPDRHQGTSCFLINIGSVFIQYGQSSKVQFDSKPFLFASNETESVDVVDCKRQEFEFKYGLENALLYKAGNPIVLFDGSLIFWHLESKSAADREEYLSKYLGLLHQYYKNNVLIAGFISLPKSKELVNLIRVKLNEAGDGAKVENITDIHVASFFLNPFERTTLFKNHSPIVEHYPEHLKPYFFYLNLGAEIVRIEIPAWIAQDAIKVELICKIIVDQCVKGLGYPVVLAEAHEQAVVKGMDREFFYQLINKLSVRHKQQILISQKSSKKRRMGI